MTTNMWVAAASMMIACVGTGQAAEKIVYEELPQLLAPFGRVVAHRGFKVTTVDGKEHAGRGLSLAPDHVRMIHRDNSYEDILSEQISRLEISQTGRFFHRIADSAAKPVREARGCGGELDLGPVCAIPVFVIFTPVWAYTAATAPFLLAADGIAFLIPSKVYDIVH